MADLARGQWYFRTYNDQTIRVVDTRAALSTAGGKVRTIKIDPVQPINDVSTTIQ